MTSEHHDSNLPVKVETGRFVTRVLPPIQLGQAPPEAVEETVPLSHYLWVLQRFRWSILAFVVACVLAAWIVSARLTPIYESTATVDIDRQSPPGVVGQDSNRTAINDADQFLATQVKLLQSDSVLRPVADKYDLVHLENPSLEKDSTKAMKLREAPMLLKNLKITRPPNTYLVLISYRSPHPTLSANVANGVAQSYIEHTYNTRIRASSNLTAFMERQLEELKAKMERSTAALAQFEKELNVINPEEKTSILSARLLQLNSEYTTAQADRVKKEAAHDSTRTGSPDAARASSQGEELRKLEERLNEAQEKHAHVVLHYGNRHPEYRNTSATLAELQRQIAAARKSIQLRVEVEYREALNREEMLRKAVAATKAEFDGINARSFDYQRLKNEAEADRKLYEELVRKIREAGINASFQNSSVRLADSARPAAKPVSPNIPLNVLLAALFSTVFGVAIAVVRDILDNTVRDPDEVTRGLGTSVIGTLPAVKDWRKRIVPVLDVAAETAVEAEKQPGYASMSSFSESIRTLRNSILLADFDRRIRSILVTSASPAEGKSTTAAHLAFSHAEQGKRTLLIDADMRRPSVHRRFEVPTDHGLTTVLLDETPWRDAVVPSRENPLLWILPAGPPSRRASRLVSTQVADLIEQASREYDLVIVDAPPLLGFAEPLELATLVDGVVVVAKAGGTNRKALGAVLTSLARVRAAVLGIVLNEVRRETSRDSYYYGHYHKYYSAVAPAQES